MLLQPLCGISVLTCIMYVIRLKLEIDLLRHVQSDESDNEKIV